MDKRSLDQEMLEVLRGRATMRSNRSNMVQVFISSTFSDMSSERRALLEKAFPEVRSFCSGLGLVFEAVDLRWGLRSHSRGDHREAEVSLKEMETCQRISLGPAFIALLGSQYGQRALPRLVPERHFEVLKAQLTPDDLQLLSQWFLKDTNIVPPTYVLQPITCHFPFYGDQKAERDTSSVSWRLVEVKLLNVLRKAASEAKVKGHLTLQQTHHFYQSAPEREMTAGLLRDGAQRDGAQRDGLLFIRDSPRQGKREGPKRLARFLAVTGDGVLDAEARELLSDLRTRLVSSCQTALHLHTLELSRGAVDPKRKEHAAYLEKLCEQLVSQMKSRISSILEEEEEEEEEEGGRRKRRRWGQLEEDQGTDFFSLLEEVSSHSSQRVQLSQELCGREGLLGRLSLALWETSAAPHPPLVLHGAPGMGKTALLCRVAQEMLHVLEPSAVVALRLLSMSRGSRPQIQHLLHSLSLQLCLAYNLPPPDPPAPHKQVELVSFFHNVLATVSKRGESLAIILDGVDLLSAADLNWLPVRVPPNVHLVLSTTTASPIMEALQGRLEAPGSFMVVEPLSLEEGEEVMERSLRSSGRSLTEEQRDLVLRSFQKTGSPLHLRLILCEALGWSSYTPPSGLGNDLQDMMSLIFLSLEERHGKELVASSLSYIALSRCGMLEAELRDVLSLDDDVISEAYRHCLPENPTLVRLPPMLWSRLRLDLDPLLVERWSSGVMLLGFRYPQVCEAVHGRYLGHQRRNRMLSEYFLGLWSRKLKPLSLSTMSLLLADRKVPPQPLWFAPGLANMRKLQELPYQLLHAGLWEELRQEVIGNADWLYCKSRLCGFDSVIEDLRMCGEHMNCTQSALLCDTLLLIKPKVDLLGGHMDMALFSTELVARLLSLAAVFPSLIGRLVSQCEDWLLTCLEPVLVPKCSFLTAPGGPLKHTFTASLLCVDVCEDILVTGSDDGSIVAWTLSSCRLLHTLLTHTAAVLSIKLIDSGTHCLSLAADGSLRRWSLLSGKQVYCVQSAMDPDSTPASLHLSQQTNSIFVYTKTQVRRWGLDSMEHLLNVSTNGSEILGILGADVVTRTVAGAVQISQQDHQSPGGQGPPGAQGLPGGQGSPDVLRSLMLPRQGRVLLLTQEGVLHQVSRSGRRTETPFPMMPCSLFMATEDERMLLAGCENSLLVFSMHHHEDCAVEKVLELQHEDCAVEKVLELHHEAQVLSACGSKNSTLLASGCQDHIIRIWSVSSGALQQCLHGMEAPVSWLSFALSDGCLVSWSRAMERVVLWSLDSDPQTRPTRRIPAGCTLLGLAKDCNHVYFVRKDCQNQVVCWDNQAGSVSDTLAVSAEVCCLELAHNKKLLFCGLKTGTILIYPLDLPQETLCIPPPERLPQVHSLALDQRERRLAAAYEGSVGLFEVTTRDGFPTVEGPVQSFSLSLLHAPVSSMVLLADGRLLYGTACGELTLYDFNTSSLTPLEAQSGRVTCVLAGNAGLQALVASGDCLLRLWSLNPLLLDHTMEYKSQDGVDARVLCAAFSESDHLVFTGSLDRTIKVWEVATGRLLYVQHLCSAALAMHTHRNGFVAVCQRGAVIREVFRCPERLAPEHNPLRNIRAQYRLTSRERAAPPPQTPSLAYDFNPAQLNFNLMSLVRAKPSTTCVLA
ncbi:unnamed protein product [Lota lota]